MATTNASLQVQSNGVDRALDTDDLGHNGTYHYASNTVAGTVDVPATGRLTRVSVLAGVSVGATVTIGGGNTITIPAGSGFDEVIPGTALGADVVIAGTVQTYYVAWTVPA